MGSSSSHCHLEHEHLRENPEGSAAHGGTQAPLALLTVLSLRLGGCGGEWREPFPGQWPYFFYTLLFLDSEFGKTQGLFLLVKCASEGVRRPRVMALQSLPFSGDPEALTPATPVLSARTRPRALRGCKNVCPHQGWE